MSELTAIELRNQKWTRDRLTVAQTQRLIRQLRAKDMTGREIARLSGLSETAISLMRRGINRAPRSLKLLLNKQVTAKREALEEA